MLIINFNFRNFLYVNDFLVVNFPPFYLIDKQEITVFILKQYKFENLKLQL